ncbi:MAG: type 1 glutamine amidotransferase domain-containing protein [Oceanococcus sp.]
MKILIPLPCVGFDPTEAAVSWYILRQAGHDIVFATPDGQRGHADPLMLSGEGLDFWGFIPLLKKIRLIGLSLRAQADARRCYRDMERDPAYLSPLCYQDLEVADFAALLLPGGHAKSMRPYLESALLQSFVADFFDSGKPVAAVCHGVVLAARSISKSSGRSVLHGRKTTALTWKLEKSAWMLTRYFARFWDPDYYRTYTEDQGQPVGYMGVQQEVTRALASPDDFCDVPKTSKNHFAKTSGLMRDTANDNKPAWVVRDGQYVSARWPGDVFSFAKTFDAVLSEQPKKQLSH